VAAENRVALAGGWKLSALLALVAVAAYSMTLVTELRRFGVADEFVLLSGAVGLASAVFVGLLIALGAKLRNDVARPRLRLYALLGVYAAYVSLLLWIVVARHEYVSWSMNVVIGALAAWALNLALNRALTRVSPEQLAERKNLTAAREWLAEQLTRRLPRIRDAWYPYLIAFGLDEQMDRWFARFGPPARASSNNDFGDSGASRDSSSSSTWSGGGGKFGGGGASGTWSAAAGAIAAGVAVASSGGSGAGGGGGSSGGGGGGGW
jgi:uncharacterized membrane protein YgcG